MWRVSAKIENNRKKLPSSGAFPPGNIFQRLMDKDNVMALFALKHKMETWLKEGQGLLQIIDSLIPSDNSRALSVMEMVERLNRACKKDTRSTG